MSDMVEKVAQAICGDDNPDNVLEIHRIRASAAIEAYQRALFPPMDFSSSSLTVEKRRPAFPLRTLAGDRVKRRLAQRRLRTPASRSLRIPTTRRIG